jgi:cytosine/adenosine deaminase-related metal-dependent hydrolase
MSLLRRLFSSAAEAALLFCAAVAWADIEITPGAADKVLLKGKIVTPDQLLEGEVLVENDTISCVAQVCAAPTGATVIRVSNAFIMPGFIDAHNHVAYNVLPKWTAPKLYKNRAQWQRDRAYKTAKAPYDRLKTTAKLVCEMVKYGEIKALVSGVTTIQGSPPDQKCFATLIRNAESESGLNIPRDYIRTFILDIKSAPSIDWSKTKSFVVHIAEGIDEKSRQEFDTLKSKGLLTGGTAIIHGTAFGDEEFRDMARAGAKLIWSPQSNLALYGQTTRIDRALSNGVPVSIGVDWNLTGSDSIFDEVRVAAHVNDETFAHAISDTAWLGMITTNPASALALGDYIGRIAPDMKADIIVVRARDPEPNRSLLSSRVEDVQIVLVDGKVLYGDAAAVDAVKPGQCEGILVHGAKKKVCVKDQSDARDKKGQTLSDIVQKLQNAFPGLAPLVQ